MNNATTIMMSDAMKQSYESRPFAPTHAHTVVYNVCERVLMRRVRMAVDRWSADVSELVDERDVSRCGEYTQGQMQYANERRLTNASVCCQCVVETV